MVCHLLLKYFQCISYLCLDEGNEQSPYLQKEVQTRVCKHGPHIRSSKRVATFEGQNVALYDWAGLQIRRDKPAFSSAARKDFERQNARLTDSLIT